MAKEKNDYFKLLEQQINYSVTAVELLENIICDYETKNLDVEKDRMHKIEHQADDLYHDILNRLSKEFITVIEQEDILRLVQIIDDITDALDEVVMDFYMYHIKAVPANSLELAKIVNRCVKALRAAIIELKNFKKSDSLPSLLNDVMSIESEADIAYMDAVHYLFGNESDYKVLLSHKTVYESLEKCCDLCEYAVEVINQIVIKNT